LCNMKKFQVLWIFLMSINDFELSKELFDLFYKLVDKYEHKD